MKKNIFTILSICLCLVFMPGCKKDSFLHVSSNNEELSAEGGTVSIEVSASEDYTVSIPSTDTWLHKIVKGSGVEGVINLSIDANDETESRSSTMTVTAGKLQEIITISQKASKPKLVLTQSEYTVHSTGDTIRIEIASNSEYTYDYDRSDTAWIYPVKSRAMPTYTHYFAVLPNETYDKRQTKIKFINSLSGDEYPIVITQMQKDAIIVAQNEYSVNCGTNELEIEVSTNVNPKVDISADWIKLSQSRALENQTLQFLIERNPKEESREALITLSSKGISQAIKIFQEARFHRIKLELQHEESSLYLPHWRGENLSGTIWWGDGNQEKYQEGLVHTYESSGVKTSVFDISGAKSFTLDKLGSISSITIYCN